MQRRCKTLILLSWGPGKGPGITAPEEDIDGGGNIEAVADVKGDLAVPEKLFA